MVNKKSKLIASLCTLILSLACLTFGVYSAVKTSFTASGTITFNAYNVECDIAVKFVGAEGGDKIIYATTNKTNSKRVQVETLSENAEIGKTANYTGATEIGSSTSLNLGALSFDEVNASKTDGERKTITMEVYIINYSGYAIQFKANANGTNGDGTVSYARHLGDDGIEIGKYEDGTPASNVGATTTFAYKIIFTANGNKTDTSNAGYNISFTIEPSTGTNVYQYAVPKVGTDGDFNKVSSVYDMNESGEAQYKNILTCKGNKEKLIVPLIYVDNVTNLNIVSSASQGQLYNFEKYGTSDLELYSAFRSQTHIAFCEGYIDIPFLGHQFATSSPYEIQLKKVILPSTTNTINCFEDCGSLTEIEIPKGVSAIPYRCFENCVTLASITIPSSVTKIGENALFGCKKLTSITFTGTKAQWNAITFGSSWNQSAGSYTVYCSDGNIE